jgi:hypothetical protein
MAPPLDAQHRRDLGAKTTPHTQQVHLDHAREVLFGVLGCLPQYSLDAGVVDGAVEPTVACDGPCDERVDVGLVGDIGDQEVRVGSEGPRCERRFLARRGDVAEYESRAVPRERQGRRASDPRRRAGYEDHPPVESSLHGRPQIRARTRP